MMPEPRGQELVERYKKNYHISPEAEITEEMVLSHWELEKRLTGEILESSRENRWEVTDRCYTELYSRLDWLNKYCNTTDCLPEEKKFHRWSSLLGKAPLSVYEIGSGKGELISFLAKSGHRCKGTEITRERGKKYTLEGSNLSWGTSDGVHLEGFEEANSFDVVISSHVVEHLHPDDLGEHLANVRGILKEGGHYLLTTPHGYIGPGDISAVFKRERTMGMHLKEYTFREMREALKRAGFRKVSAVWSLIPQGICRTLGVSINPRRSRLYLSYLCFLEGFLGRIPSQSVRRVVSLLAVGLFFEPFIFLMAEK